MIKFLRKIIKRRKRREKNVISIFGGGSFGTVLADIAAHNGHIVYLWMRDEEVVNTIKETHENTHYLPGYKLHRAIQPTTDLEQAAQSASMLFLSVPSKSFREVAYQLRDYTTEDQLLISTTKGIESSSFKLMSEILAEEMYSDYVGVMSGPNIAKEIAEHQLTATVIASKSDEVRQAVREALSNSYFRVYENTDVYGVELAGALKNIYAILSGMAVALGAGENTKSMLITRGLAEMSQFAVRLGANPLTFLGLAGVGDLIVTCSSPHSRNFRVGHAIGQGQSLDEIVKSLGQVAEGVNTLTVVKQKADAMQLDMPLVNGLYEILFKAQPPEKIVLEFMLEQSHHRDIDFRIK